MQPAQELLGATDRPDRVAASPDRLRSGQVASLAALGVLYWFLAAMFIRYAAPMGVFERGAGAALFALTVPCAWLLIWTVERAAALRPTQLVAGVAVATAPAVLCDGAALTWAPALYGGGGAGLLPAAAWLLWSVGVTLATAVVAARRQGA